MGTLIVGGKKVSVTLAVGPSSGSAPVQEVNFGGSITIAYDLQSGTNMQFVTRASDPAAFYIDELATDVWLYGDLIQARFRAWAVWQEWFQNGQDNVNTMAVTYKKLLSRRNVFGSGGLVFNNVDLGQIIWGMWQHTQAQPGGNLGITLGTPNTTGIIRSRTYKQGENLGQLAENEYEEGIWWDIDENKVFRAGARATMPWLATPLHLGNNVREMQRASGSDFANAVYADADESATTPVWALASNVATDPRGRWELTSGWPTVKEQSTLNERAASFLSVSNVPVAHWNIEMEPARWVTDSKIKPGMFAVLVIPRTLAAPIGPPAVQVVVFVSTISVSYDEDGKLEVKAVAMERPDIPVPTTTIVNGLIGV